MGRDGSLKWRSDRILSGTPLKPAIITNGMLIVPHMDMVGSWEFSNFFDAFHTTNGSLKWGFNVSGYGWNYMPWLSPDGTLLIGSDDTMYAMSILDGVKTQSLTIPSSAIRFDAFVV